MTKKPSNENEPLERRGDNVGQSARWRRMDGTQDDEVARRYGHEERWHSSEHPAGEPDESLQREPNVDKPNTSAYEGQSGAPKGAEQDDDDSRYGDQSYAEAGGEIGGDRPRFPSRRWEEQGGAGEGEGYGVGRDGEDSEK